MTTNQDIVTASTLLLVEANEVIQVMQNIRAINKECWAMTTADTSKIEESIKQIAKAQSLLRKLRETATIRIA